MLLVGGALFQFVTIHIHHHIHHKFMNINSENLVGGFNPLKNMTSSVGMIIPKYSQDMGKKWQVPNQQCESYPIPHQNIPLLSIQSWSIIGIHGSSWLPSSFLSTFDCGNNGVH